MAVNRYVAYRWMGLVAVACLAAVLWAPLVRHASFSPSDSVLHCVLLNEEDWPQGDVEVAGKRASELNVGEPRTVRMIYFLPNDRPYRQSVVDTMKARMVRMQAFFGEQMEAHGYGYMTFRYEADAAGEPVVHRLDGEHGDRHYLENTFDRFQEEFLSAYERDYHVYFMVIDNSTERLHLHGGGSASGLGGGLRHRGLAVTTTYFPFTLAAHEMMHALGLGWHGFFDDAYKGRWQIGISACSAAFLSVSPFLNPEIPIEKDFASDPTIEYIGRTQWYPAGTHRFTLPLRISDPDGVHQVILLSTNQPPAALFKACRVMAGETKAEVAFEYDGLIPFWDNSSFSNPTTHTFQAVVVDRYAHDFSVAFGIAQASSYHLATFAWRGSHWVTCLAFSPDGGILAAGSVGDRTVRLWDVTAREEIAVLEGHRNAPASVAFSPDGGILVSGAWFGRIKVWDVAARETVATLVGHTAIVRSVAFSPDGSIVASGSWDGTVRLWDTSAWDEIGVLEGHTNMIASVAFSPDGSIVASGSWDGTVRLWDVATQREVARLDRHTDTVKSVVFSPDGSIVASGSTDGTVRLWDTAAWEEIGVLEGRDRFIWSIAFSPDGGKLAVAALSGRADLWDVLSSKVVETYAHLGAIHSIAFSPDGGMLAAATDRIELWDTSSHMESVSGIPDWDGDGEVGFGDFVKFAAKFGHNRGQAGYDPRFDLDTDGAIGFNDFLIFACAFGKTA